jgi:hypothetical protein
MTATPSQPSSGSSGSGSKSHQGGSHHASRPSPPAVTADGADGRSQAAALGHLGLPVYYPRVIADGSSYCYANDSNCYLEIPSPGSYPRKYRIADRSGHRYWAYRMTLELNPVLGQYYGIQGMGWQDPPILNNPSYTRTVNGKRLEVYAGGGNVELVAWHTLQGVYWVSNSLTNTLTPRQMIAIAASFTRGR